MNINVQLNSLYDNWIFERKYDSFIRGGIVDETGYNHSRYKVLYILKEANTEDTHWSQVDLLNAIINRERTFYEIFKTIILLNLVFFQGPYNYMDNNKFGQYFSDAGLMDSLSTIGFTNIKKEKGGPNSIWEDIHSYAVNDRDYLLKEIECINPAIIVCCGTFEFLKIALEFDVQKCGTGAEYAIYENRVFIDIPHPKAYIKRNVLYTYFKETVVDLIDSKVIK